MFLSSDIYSIHFVDQEWLEPIPVDMFPERVQQMHEDREKKFEVEYNVSVAMHTSISDNEHQYTMLWSS